MPPERTEESYPIGYDHRIAIRDTAVRERENIIGELDKLRSDRVLYDEQSDFDIKSRSQAADILATVIDHLAACIKDDNQSSGKSAIDRYPDPSMLVGGTKR